ncbi:MAG: alpha/beta hydrolase [Candidatus Omnitrophica bacterium]|nr:alpha/beta hydrolase [Candidatus Omnitrophota bacterium]
MALSHKPNLVFLHGWGTDPLVWKYQLDHFSKRYEVECPSGLNFKSQPALRGEDCVLVGWSHGGMLALKIAVGSKDIAALVLVASSAKFTDAENGMRPLCARIHSG